MQKKAPRGFRVYILKIWTSFLENKEVEELKKLTKADLTDFFQVSF
jgi:hypothetical protein